MILTPLQALSRATGSLVAEHDLLDVLATLLSDACTALDADAAGILIVTSEQGLDVLAATTHGAHILELLQAQQRQGPCVEAITGDTTVVEAGASGLSRRWPDLAPIMAAAGYDAVHAHPLRWQERTLGAINFFRAATHTSSPDSLVAGQAFADVVTLLMLLPPKYSDEQIEGRTQLALEGRTVIEHAKGVLMHQERLDSAQAYALLSRLAAGKRLSLTRAAQQVIHDATRR
ncbi:ANTAR domain-containing protein [Terrabacter sp. BE26]|uniref:ANTAR domain-containing protein n=1 Tax=Terrabacter sp. BE26 TaxID=2898152 RepID=UPI0035BE588C